MTQMKKKIGASVALHSTTAAVVYNQNAGDYYGGTSEIGGGPSCSGTNGPARC